MWLPVVVAPPGLVGTSRQLAASCVWNMCVHSRRPDLARLLHMLTRQDAVLLSNAAASVAWFKICTPGSSEQLCI